MRKLLPSIYISLLLLTAFTAAAQQQTMPAPGTPKNFTLPAKQEFALPNGLQATLVPFGDIPKVTVSMVVQAGNVHEAQNENGLADIVGELMQEGTTSRTAKQLADEIAGMGGTLAVGVSGDQTTLTGSALSEYGPELVTIMADMLQHPLFPASEIDRIKSDFKREMNLARSRPNVQARVKFNSILYDGHPYGRELPTDQEIDAYTVEKVRDFYQNQYGAQRTAVYVAGKFDAAKMQEAIKSSLSDWQQGPSPHIAVAQPAPKPGTTVIDRPGAPQSTIVLGLPAIDPTNPDFLTLRVANSLLGGSFGSRITTNIREDKGYTYSPYSSLMSRYRTGEWMEVADVTTEHTGNSLKEIVYEINRLRNEAPPAEEMTGIQNYEAGIFVLRNSTPGGIIGQLSFLDLHGLPDEFLTNQVQRIHAITPDQIKDVTRKYLRPTDMTLVVVGDKKVIAPQLKKFQEEVKKAPVTQ